MILVPANPTPGSLAPAEAAAARYRRSADAAETLRGYRRDWQAFADWCAERHAAALPAAPATVGAHLAALADAGRALATLRRRLAAIARAHRSAGHRLDAGHPAIRESAARHRPQHRPAAAPCRRALHRRGQGARRRLRRPGRSGSAGNSSSRCATARCCSSAMPRRSAAASLPPCRSSTWPSRRPACGCCCRGRRPMSRAPGRRSSSPAARLRPVARWRRWKLGCGPRSSATARSGAPSTRAEPAPPASPPWAGLDPACGLSGEAIRLILRRRAAAAGITGTALEPISPHGLRAGFVTEAYRAGVPDEAIMGQYPAPRPGLDAPLCPPRPARGRYADPQARAVGGR
ncbi:hypothetical protein [Dankookia sp. P2]|uniref:hypothetical protein n=1 Tax=Dankookia sp. P2 TaxID=3423955 RepID=UPI003D6725A7